MTDTHRKRTLLGSARTFISVAFATAFVAACSDGTTTIGTGGGAGDGTEENSEAIALITPLVGFYTLPSNWAGVPESDAFFEVQTPDDSGVSTALVYRVDSFQNCIENRPSSGEITQDLFSDRLFLDDIFELENGIVSLSGNSLVIDLPADVQDIDNDGDFGEPAQLQAPNVAVAQITDLGEFCSTTT